MSGNKWNKRNGDASRPRVRTKAVLALLEAHKVSMGAVGREMNTSRQYIHSLIHGFTPVGPRAHRDVPIVIAKLTNLDPTTVRSQIFSYPKGA